MHDKDQFRAVKHAGVTYKPRGDGGMLVFYDQTSVRIYVNGPNELPWASEKTREKPRWTRTRGSSALDFGAMRRKVIDYQERVLLAGPNRALREPKRATAYAAFLQHIDAVHLDELADISLRAFNYYSAMRRCDGLFDLATSGRREPGLAGGSALAYALSNVNLLMSRCPSRPLDLVRRLVRRKRRDIMVTLGFPREAAGIAVRAMERIVRGAIRVDTIEMLRNLLTHGDKLTRKRIAHCDQISHAFLRVQCDPLLAPSLTSRLLDELVDPPNRVAELVDNYWLLEDVGRMAYHLGDTLPLLHSLAQVNALHRTLINRATASKQSQPSRVLPPAPLPSLPGHIEYIGTSDALEAEGRTMHNCVGSYATVVERGAAFIYSVLSPERCTLAIELGTDARFHVREIKTACNAAVRSPETLGTVHSWLASHQDPDAIQQVRALQIASGLQRWANNPDPQLGDPDIWDVPF